MKGYLGRAHWVTSVGVLIWASSLSPATAYIINLMECQIFLNIPVLGTHVGHRRRQPMINGPFTYETEVVLTIIVGSVDLQIEI